MHFKVDIGCHLVVLDRSPINIKLELRFSCVECQTSVVSCHEEKSCQVASAETVGRFGNPSSRTCDLLVSVVVEYDGEFWMMGKRALMRRFEFWLCCLSKMLSSLQTSASLTNLACFRIENCAGICYR